MHDWDGICEGALSRLARITIAVAMVGGIQQRAAGRLQRRQIYGVAPGFCI